MEADIIASCRREGYEEPRRKLSKCCVVIPALNPSSTLLDLASALLGAGFGRIVVVDDGSSVDSRPLFARLEDLGIIVLHHAENSGKGMALKTGFEYLRTQPCSAVVTVDADGQHAPADVVGVAEGLLNMPAPACVLGVRSFGGQIPLRSKLGNLLTQRVFSACSPVSISDTQTGLRGFSSDMLPQLCAIPGSRYEFEMEMLLWLMREGIPVREMPIATIYLDNNAQSHFRPLIDSFRIYWVLFRDAFVATSSFGIDIVLFSVFFALSGSVLGSTYLARIVSGTYNFLANRHFVFKTAEHGRFVGEAFQYVLLAVAIASVSGLLVGWMYEFTALDITLCKVLVDLSVYGISFVLRRYVIFAARRV